MFRATTEHIDDRKVSRHRILCDDAVLSYFDVLRLWRSDSEFREFFVSLLADSQFDAYRWETPPVTLKSVHQAFEFVLIHSPSFIRRHSDKDAFNDHFSDSDVDEGVVSFSNLGGDAMLVVPSPRSDIEAYGHLAAFIRLAPKKQVETLWRIVGETLSSEINENPTWLSTAGGGVAWLHVRIDESPKYYGYAPYRRYP